MRPGFEADFVVVSADVEAGLAVGETVILLHPPLPLAGVSIRNMEGDVSKMTERSPTAKVDPAALATAEVEQTYVAGQLRYDRAAAAAAAGSCIASIAPAIHWVPCEFGKEGRGNKMERGLATGLNPYQQIACTLSATAIARCDAEQRAGCLLTAFSLPFLDLSLHFHSLSLMFHCIFTALPWWPSTDPSDPSGAGWGVTVAGGHGCQGQAARRAPWAGRTPRGRTVKTHPRFLYESERFNCEPPKPPIANPQINMPASVVWR